MTKKIVADSGPLISLGKIDRLSLISKLAGKILIPQAVADECLADLSLPGAHAIQKGLDENLIEIYLLPESAKQPILLSLLDKGESEAILLSLYLNIPILIDEKIGRQVARKNGLSIIGIGGLLIAAKKKGLIKKVSPIIKDLQQNGYYLSKELVSEILSKVQE